MEEVRLVKYKYMEEPKPIDQQSVDTVIAWWNGFDIGKITGTKKQFKTIDRCIVKYGLMDVLGAITNYNKILNDKSYYFSHKYSVDMFFRTASADGTPVEKFKEDGALTQSYYIRNNKIPTAFIERVTTTIGYDSWLKESKAMNYKDYLLTDHWLHFRIEALKHSDHRCQLCNKDRVKLHVHHKTYENRGRETFNDIIVLCEECHSLVHTQKGTK